MHSTDSNPAQIPTLRGSAQFRFCSGKCQVARPPEGGVELTPGKWRCGACWIEISRKRQ